MPRILHILWGMTAGVTGILPYPMAMGLEVGQFGIIIPKIR
jgi:hypothetical protein